MTSLKEEKANRSSYQSLGQYCRSVWRRGENIVGVLERATHTDLKRCYTHLYPKAWKSVNRKSKPKLTLLLTEYFLEHFNTNPVVLFRPGATWRTTIQQWDSATLELDTRWWRVRFGSDFPQFEDNLTGWVLELRDYKRPGEKVKYPMPFPEDCPKMISWFKGDFPNGWFADWLEEEEKKWPCCPKEFLWDLRLPLSPFGAV